MPTRGEQLGPDVLGVLTAHDYLGNVRELQNIIEHAFMLLSEGQIKLEHLPVDLVPITAGPAPRSTVCGYFVDKHASTALTPGSSLW